MKLSLSSRSCIRPFSKGTRPPRPCRCSPVATPSLSSRLADSEASGDWTAALEVVTEAKVLKTELLTEDYECAVRIFAGSGSQWKRAIDLYQALLEKKVQPSVSTSQALFQALVQERQGKVAFELLQKLDQALQDPPVSSPFPLSPLYNMTTRALVRQGEVESAMELLQNMLKSDGRIMAEAATFTSLAGELLRRGDDDRAEEVLEMRDYL